MFDNNAKRLACLIKDQQLLSVEVAQFYIDRIVKHNSAINAVIAERFELTLDEARQADEQVHVGSLWVLFMDYL